MKLEYWQLQQRQGLSLEQKVEYAKRKIREWHWHWSGQVYVSFSGGKDSTVLLDLVRSEFPEVPAVFVDTGLEYPEIREFVKTFENVVWLKPKMAFPEVIKKYGYPVVSKSVSDKIAKIRRAEGVVTDSVRLYLTGITSEGEYIPQFILPKKWRFLMGAPFKISEKCCDIMKKSPFYRYTKESNRYPIAGVMAGDSIRRKSTYLQTGCNSFEGSIMSRPISIWLEKDVWNYIKTRNIPYSRIYDMGEKRTGCMFCMFGLHLEKLPNRFDRMKHSHPKQYAYCMDKLGLREVMRYVRSGMQREFFVEQEECSMIERKK